MIPPGPHRASGILLILAGLYSDLRNFNPNFARLSALGDSSRTCRRFPALRAVRQGPQ
jgi:hypothetical protein